VKKGILVFVSVLFIVVAIFMYQIGKCKFAGDPAMRTYFATFFGSAIGGAGTLTAVWLTILDGKKSLEMEMKNHHQENELQRKIEFVNNIALLIGEFKSGQIKYFWGSIKIERLMKEKKRIKDNEQTVSTIRDEINRIHSEGGGIISTENVPHFTLQTLLYDVEEAAGLSQLVEEICRDENKIIADFSKGDFNSEKIAEWEEKQLKRIDKEYSEFKKAYLKKESK